VDAGRERRSRQARRVAPGSVLESGAHHAYDPVRQGTDRHPHQRGQPGYTATDLNGNTGPQTVTEGTYAIVALATEGPGHGSGRFVDRDGEIKWS